MLFIFLRDMLLKQILRGPGRDCDCDRDRDRDRDRVRFKRSMRGDVVTDTVTVTEYLF
jgi:hypothetical protein